MPDAFPALGGGLFELLGIEIVELEAERAVATMPVTSDHLQPLGYLHGGASVALAESIVSVAAAASVWPEQIAFGLEINANHLRPKRDGLLTATAERLHAGRTTQVWQVRITDEEDKLVCVSRCTIALVDTPGSE